MSTHHHFTSVLINTLCTLLVMAGFAFGPATAFGQTPPTFVNGTLIAACSVTVYGDNAPYVLAVGDFNKDGVPDLITECTDGWAIQLGNGGGTFQPPVYIAHNGGANQGSIVTGDFNNDGDLDFAVTYGPSSTPGTLTIFLGNGAGGFATGASYSLLGVVSYNTTAGGLVATDLRGNGHLDLIAMDPSKQGVDVFLGNGDGTFVSPTSAVGVPGR